MAYPTLNFQPVPQFAGIQPIDETSATQQHPLGTIVTAKDDTYGVGEFIYLEGVASTAAGDAVTYTVKPSATVRAVAAGRGAVAVAMSANVAGQYGWYCITGCVPVAAAASAAAGVVYLTSTAGTLDDAVVAGDKVDGAVFTEAISGGFSTLQLSRPSATGSA